MTACCSFVILAAPNWELVKLIVIAMLMILAPIRKKINEKREQAERAKMPKRPAPTPPPPQARDNRFRSEVEAFLDEVGRRRSDQPSRPEVGRGPAPVRPASAGPSPGKPAPVRTESETTASAGPQKARPLPRPQPSKPVTQRPAEAATRKKAEAPRSATPPGARQRPGTDIASRKAPVSEDLGTQIRSHLTQYLDASRMSQRVQSDLGNSIEQVVQEHLGESGIRPLSAKTPGAATGSPILSLLRSQAGVRAAIVMNEILGPPKGLHRKT